MALRKKKYKFSDEMMSVDAMISLIMGGIALASIVFFVVYSIVRKGVVPEFFGTLLLACFVMSLTAFLFGLFSYRDQDGGVLSKRASVIISVIDVAACVCIYVI